MKNQIVVTTVVGEFSGLATGGKTAGTTGALSMETLNRAPDAVNPLFEVYAVTPSHGGFSMHATGDHTARNAHHKPTGR